MKRRLRNLSRRYQAALRTHLRQGQPASLKAAHGLGSRALAAGVRPVDLARLHEQILVAELLPARPAATRARLIRRAGAFFAVAIAPIGTFQRGAQGSTTDFNTLIQTLSQRAVELAVSNQELSLEITHRKAVEEALKASERHYSRLLEQSDRLQEQLRRLSRQILLAQEEERKRISRELHDVIAQSLTGINLRLAALKTESTANTEGIQRKIASTQRLVARSVGIVHRFARDLRPAMLDDLGLIPALRSFMLAFSAQTGVRTRLTAFAGVEKLDAARRTVLFRVAQEALTNVARHAQASRAQVTIQRMPDRIRMKITDNGRAFHVQRVMHSMGRIRLGLLGMRERLEMVGGHFGVESTPGTGTTIEADIPLRKAELRRKPRKEVR